MRASGWGPLVVAIASVIAIGWAETRGSSSQSTRTEGIVTPAARDLLGGLRVGDRVAGWDVESITMPQRDRIRIDLGRGKVGFAITIAALGTLPHGPALQTERFAIYYGHARPQEVTLPRGGVRAVLHQLRRRIQANEANVDL